MGAHTDARRYPARRVGRKDGHASVTRGASGSTSELMNTDPDPEAGPPYGLIERAPTDDDFDELFDLHRDSLCESVAATYGWDDDDQRQRFHAAWESRKSQHLLVAGERIVAAWQVEKHE